MKIECPRCHQDWIRKVHVGVLDEVIYICGECEAVWKSPQSISFPGFVSLFDFLNQSGVPYSQETFDTFCFDDKWPPNDGVLS
jgi:hypothetical protein